ncbi:MAG: DUF819 domain-containing protein [Nannocystaceae bacterium]|nr:DUF819 family protein [bacterium]
MTDPVFVAAILAACVLASQWLVDHTLLRHAGVALLVIVVTAVVSNLGVIPTSGSPVYDGVFGYVAPLSIFWLLLGVNLRAVLEAGPKLLVLFLLGALGTALGVALALALLSDAPFGEQTPAMAGMFAATYIGGSANFNAIALHYDIVQTGPLYAGAMAVDSGITAVWMAATIALPRWLGGTVGESLGDDASAEDPDREAIAPRDLAVLLALGLGCAWVSGLLAGPTGLPSMLILTSLALVLAQFRVVANLSGARSVGMFAVYVFLATIGALCDVAALGSLGALGGRLAILAVAAVGMNGLVSFGAAKLLRMDPVLAAVASQANVGGGTTALALARSLGRADLVLPAVLVGSVGTALGTFVGFLLAGWLGA